MRTALAAVALVAVLAACGRAPRRTSRQAFRGYHTALLARDFRTACSYNTPEATDKLIGSLRTQGIDAGGCEDAFAAIYAEDGGSAAADGVGNTVQIQGITVDGDNATVELDRRARRRAAAGADHACAGSTAGGSSWPTEADR